MMKTSRYFLTFVEWSGGIVLTCSAVSVICGLISSESLIVEIPAFIAAAVALYMGLLNILLFIPTLVCIHILDRTEGTKQSIFLRPALILNVSSIVALALMVAWLMSHGSA